MVILNLMALCHFGSSQLFYAIRIRSQELTYFVLLLTSFPTIHGAIRGPDVRRGSKKNQKDITSPDAL